MSKIRIRKLGILSTSKIYAVISLFMSLLISIPWGLMVIFASLTGGGGAGEQDVSAGLTSGGIGFGLLIMIGLPIFYGGAGFIAGVFSVLIYNITAGIVGGVECEVENVN